MFIKRAKRKSASNLVGQGSVEDLEVDRSLQVLSDFKVQVGIICQVLENYKLNQLDSGRDSL